MGSADRPVVLTGPKASGKATLGKVLAQGLGVDFIDTDEEVQREMDMTVCDIVGFFWLGEVQKGKIGGF